MHFVVKKSTGSTSSPQAGEEVAGGDFLQFGAVCAAVVLGLGAAGIKRTAGWRSGGDFVGDADAVAADMGIGQGYG